MFLKIFLLYLFQLIQFKEWKPAIHLDNRYRLMRHEPMLDADGKVTDVLGEDCNWEERENNRVILMASNLNTIIATHCNGVNNILWWQEEEFLKSIKRFNLIRCHSHCAHTEYHLQKTSIERSTTWVVSLATVGFVYGSIRPTFRRLVPSFAEDMMQKYCMPFPGHHYEF